MTNCNCNSNCPTLRFGMQGSAVSFVQRLLRQRGYRITIDGRYGSRTQSVVLSFQYNNNLPQTGNVDAATWRALGVTCLPNNITGRPQPVVPSVPIIPGFVPNDPNRPQILPSFPDQPVDSGPSIADIPQILPSFPDQPVDPGPSIADRPQILPSFPDRPVNEPNLDGLNFVWEEIEPFRYILATNKSSYAAGENVLITFRKRNISDHTQILRYPSSQLFDFYISDARGNELFRWSDAANFGGIPHEMVLSPGEAESIELVWTQHTTYGNWITPQQLTLWGVNTAVDISIPLQFVIY